MEFLHSLCEQMTRRAPSERPTAQQAQAIFLDIISRQQASAFFSRLHGREEKFIPMIFRDIRAAARETRRRAWRMISTGETLANDESQ